MRFFNKPKTQPVIEETPTLAKDEYDLSEVMGKNGLNTLVDKAIEDMVQKSNDFNAYEVQENQGNFYGSEFNIRATAGRIKSTYTREPWVFATGNLIARTLSTVPYVVKSKRTNEIIPNHPLLEKIALGSPIQDAYSMNWSGYLDLILGGNYFQVFDKKFKECIHVPVEDVQLNYTADGKRIESITVYDQNQFTSSGVDIPYEQVIHRKFPNPFNRYYGLSLYVAASRPVILDRYMNEFNMAFYLRGATNAGVIETTEDIGRTRMERLIRTFEALYTGKRNWFRTIFIPKGGKWIKSGLTMAESQHLESLRENRLTILAVLGIPPAKVGITSDVNRATSDNQDKDFWENTVAPLAKFIAAGWNNSYLVTSIYKSEVYIEPDFTEVKALAGDPEEIGKHITAVKDVLWIDEIRTDILGYEPLPDGKGERFVSEVSGSSDPFAGLLSVANSSDDVLEELKAVEESAVGAAKEAATAGQEKLESNLSKAYLKGFDKYIDALISLSIHALKNNIDVKQFLSSHIEDLKTKYLDGTEKYLFEAVKRGFSLANSTTKAFTNISIKFAHARKKLVLKDTINYRKKFNEVDQQAIDLLRDQQADGQRTTLVARAIDNFLGFNDTRTSEILDIIADGFEKGDTADIIAGTLRSIYKENYKNQAFTIARTEILTAISQGLKWNHDVLGEVFSTVEKQWFHVGDVGSNPDARAEHYAFELEGAQKRGYKWGGIMEYPRDPAGGAAETINCRCTLANIIPEGATSNAEIIIDTYLR